MNWNYIIIEGFCAKNWDYNRKHNKYDYEFKDGMFEEKVLNPDYDPSVKKPNRPKYCKKKICSKCIKCKYLAYSKIDEELMAEINEVINKHVDEDDE
jgi:hypothetical protein